MTTTDITCVLIANRGEIARRVIAACRSQGLRCVAVFSDADSQAPHVREADVAVRLPGSAPHDTYLRGDLLIAAARATGADAVHPGYGFLSENAEFAAAVAAAGLTWIGPPAAAIAAMGDKVAAKVLLQRTPVPLLSSLDPAAITASDLPVVIKAAAGGGGRGMRVVRDLDSLTDHLEAASTEAASAFGDGTVFVEPYVESGHHIEVQILADRAGTIWAVGERECSIQRRHQKIIEEAPSPLVERHPAMRPALYAAATDVAAVIGYEGAGTVEFLADNQGRFWFLEMNTRLQVEHPVTELTTGLDLVGLQLRLAAGDPLPGPLPPPTLGSAVEARLYAEDPAANWAPQIGTLRTLDVPGVGARFGPLPSGRSGIRLDDGVGDGSPVSVHYDPMLAKIITWAPERAAAIRLLAEALTRARIHGVRTNRDLLVRVLAHPQFRDGQTDTALLARVGLDTLAAPLLDADEVALATLAAALADLAYRRSTAGVQVGLPPGWRNLPSAPTRKVFTHLGDPVEVAYSLHRRHLHAPDHPGVALVEASADSVVLEVEGVRRCWRVSRSGDEINLDTDRGALTLRALPRLPEPVAAAATGSLVAPLPGVVVQVRVSEGQLVELGEPLVVLEAMKMLHTIAAPRAGRVSRLVARGGDHVEVGALLAVIDDPANPHASTTPTQSTQPTQPTESTQSTQPTQSTESTQSTQRIQPTEPTQPTQPTDEGVSP